MREILFAPRQVMFVGHEDDSTIGLMFDCELFFIEF